MTDRVRIQLIKAFLSKIEVLLTQSSFEGECDLGLSRLLIALFVSKFKVASRGMEFKCFGHREVFTFEVVVHLILK